MLICHPRLVQTGLDLVDWPSIVWYETKYSVYVPRQASRRSWRIDQREPVEVTFLVYEGTLQAEALALVAAKMRSALMVEGQLPEDGLAALEGDGQDMFLALARRLAGRSTGDGQPLEAIFARTREQELNAERYLVDGNWEFPAAPSPALESPQPEGNGAELGRLAFSGAVDPDVLTPIEPPQPRNGRMVSFEELVAILGRPRRQRKRVPPGQLTLFTA